MNESMQRIKLDAFVKPVTRLVIVCFTVYLAYLVAQFSWFVVQEPQKPIPSTFSSAVDRTAAGRTVDRAIDRYHLFGEFNQKVVVEDAPKDAPKTNLRLRLKGVFMAEDRSQSSAIIEEIGKASEYFKIGDALPGNASLADVYTDRVLLNRAGKYETLYFDEATSSKPIAKVTKQAPREQRDISTPEDFIQEATQRLSDNPERALASVGLGLADNGGYVYQGNNPMLAGMNLEKGDVIRSVNGHNLGDVQKDKEMMRSLYQQGSIEVEVVRDGASFYVNYPLR